MHQHANTIIESLGVYLPPSVLTTDEVVRGCKLGLPIPLERLTGIRSRRVASPGQASLDLAREAMLSCLDRSKYEPADIDVLICCSISKAQSSTACLIEPMLSYYLQQSVGLLNAVAFDITNACAGLFTGIAIADALLKAGGARRLMVVSGEWTSYVIPGAQQEIASLVDQRIPCLTVGDAGAAVILESSSDRRVGFQSIDLYTLGRYSRLCIVKPSEREHGGLMMVTDSIRISLTSIPQAVQHLAWQLERQGWSLDDVGHLIPHQTSRTSLQDAARQLTARLGAPVDLNGKNVDNLSERGNTATTTHLVALEDAILDGRIRSGENVAFSITGSGITIGTALYTFDDLPDRRRAWESNPRTTVKSPLDRSARPAIFRPTRHVRVESVGTTVASETARDTIGLVRAAARACIGRSSYQPTDVDLLIFAGLYRTDQIIEPAIAALIAGDLSLNDDAIALTAGKTFAFDLVNGALGFLNACQVASSMIAAGRARTAMVVASEVEHHHDDPVWPRIGLCEAGSAVILDDSGERGPGFSCFGVMTYPDHHDALNVSALQLEGSVVLKFDRHPWIEELYLECISDAIRRFLFDVGLTLSDLTVVIPPQVSPWLCQALGEQLGLPPTKLIDVAIEGQDLFSSSIPFALDDVRRRDLVRSGDVGLIVAVGSGIQVGCALYHF
jgi:3-oxoacyl-[acyl-carrier-protein] synthase III